MRPLIPEEFDAIETDAAYSGDHRAAAEQMAQLAAAGAPAAGMSRAEAYLRVGEQWLQADDGAAAADCCRRAIADGGRVSVDPRAPLARALFLLGQPAEARALIAAVKTDGRRSPRTCDQVAELLVDYDDLPGALEWATAGIELCLHAVGEAAGNAGAAELRLLLRLRYRIRNDLGLPEDRYDEMLDDA